VRSQPHPAQRARDHRGLLLRRRWVRALARTAVVRPVPRSRAHRSGRRPARGNARRHARPRRRPDRREGPCRSGSRLMSSTKTRKPRLNHVAMSMPADALDAEGRATITKFYGDVFGWMEYDMLTEDRRRLVMRVHSDEQFIFLIADESPMSAPRMD